MRGLAGWTCMLRAAQMCSIYISNSFTLIAFFTLKLPHSIIVRNRRSKKLILNCHKINRREDNETEAMNYQVGSAKTSWPLNYTNLTKYQSLLISDGITVRRFWCIISCFSVIFTSYLRIFFPLRSKR